MEPDPEITSACGEIAEEVRDIAISLCVGRLSPPVFEKAVLALESAKLRRFGFRLLTESLPPNGSRFQLVSLRTGRSCATLDFHSPGEALEIHHLCG